MKVVRLWTARLPAFRGAAVLCIAVIAVLQVSRMLQASMEIACCCYLPVPQMLPVYASQ